jgi:hypothetical protein
MTDEKKLCHDHCELVVRLAEWRLKTDDDMKGVKERMQDINDKIDRFVDGTGRLKAAAWIVLILVLAQDQGGKVLDILVHVFSK